MRALQAPQSGAARVLVGIAMNAALAITVTAAQQVVATMVQEHLERRRDSRIAAKKSSVGFRG